MIETFGDLRVWFKDRLEAALDRRGVEAGADTRAYLVELLAAVGVRAAGAVSERPLALQLAEANETREVPERIARYRAIGDEALCLSGLFSDHLEKRGVTESYVASMGSGAYATVEALALRDAAEARRAFAYRELATRFRDFSVVLDEVRESTTMRTPQDIVRLYDKWRRTRSPLVAERLGAEGVFPGFGDGGPTFH